MASSISRKTRILGRHMLRGKSLSLMRCQFLSEIGSMKLSKISQWKSKLIHLLILIPSRIPKMKLSQNFCKGHPFYLCFDFMCKSPITLTYSPSATVFSIGALIIVNFSRTVCKWIDWICCVLMTFISLNWDYPILVMMGKNDQTD